MTPTYCPLAWVGLNILPTSIQPCCHWHGIGDLPDTPEKLGHSPVFENTRKSMLLGEKVAGCKQCYLAEESGIMSRRQMAIHEYGYVDKVETKELDVSFDNLCNLKCRGCASSNSHLWFNDEIEIYGQTFFDSKFVEIEYDIDLSNLQNIAVSGGEPFLSKKFERLTKKLLERDLAKNINLTIDTNGTTLPTVDVYNFILDCKSLHLSVSVDGIGHLNEYFRSGSNFDDILKTLNYFRNLKDLRQHKSTIIQIHTTVSVYNVNLLKEIESYLNKNYPEYNFSHRLLYWPSQLSVKHLPKSYKEKLLPIVESFGKEYSYIVYELQQESENLFDHFLNFHEQLDTLRNEFLADSNPLLSQFIETYERKQLNSKVFFLKEMDKIKCGI